ncbi:hypothetical protein [Bradyrhizobium sp.]|jgi:hypothetical protein|uniref:hypothetical protein n=1 Tax=Bradyrhizobium sp. TaxID=376 RepID=UPI002D389261|nr:hypothetical protein [Bradyrhizobium sp.]HZR77512.1 hypothetical protein [Bradyrhizobium sp.]
MAFVKTLLFPLAVCGALLLPEYELWSLDYWSDTPGGASSLLAISGGATSKLDPVGYADSQGWMVAPWDDDDDD